MAFETQRVYLDKCSSMKNVWVVDSEELTINTDKNKKPDVLQVFRCPLCDKCYRRECFFNKHMGYSDSVR